MDLNRDLFLETVLEFCFQYDSRVDFNLDWYLFLVVGTRSDIQLIEGNR